MKECVHIFYDYDYINNESLLTSWITDILFTLSKKKLYRYSYEYYDDAKKFKKDIFPNTLTHLALGQNYNRTFDQDVLPKNLQMMYLGEHYNRTFKTNNKIKTS